MEIILGLLLLGVIVGGAIIYTQGSTRRRGEQLEDAKAEAVGSPSGWAARCSV